MTHDAERTLTDDIHSVPTITHGRVMVRRARATGARGLLVGFHGYMENAAIQMDRLAAIPGATAWTLVSIQGLHRVYDRRTQAVVASWMTHEDREDAIADNLAYMHAVLDAVPHSPSRPMVFAGFSQGVAMAYRAACRASLSSAGIIAVGGDVPPELLADDAVRFPRVLLLRGETDEYYSAAAFEADVRELRARNAPLESRVVAGGHEWGLPVSAAAGDFLNAVAS